MINLSDLRYIPYLIDLIKYKPIESQKDYI